MTLARVIADPAASGTWTLVPDRSSVRFSNKTMWGLVPVNGRFTEFTGEGRIASRDDVSGRLVVQAASLKTGMGKRDERSDRVGVHRKSENQTGPQKTSCPPEWEPVKETGRQWSNHTGKNREFFASD